MNVVAVFQAYKFTHFVNNSIAKTKSPEKLSTVGKIKTLIFGINNPRPININKPISYYETVLLQSNKKIECWYMKKDSSAEADSIKGTIIIFHGYGGDKSSMLDKAYILDSLNYDIFLVDFMGSGGSEGNQTTLGYKEAEEVKTAFDYLTDKNEKNIYLLGTSMGSVAIMKAINDYEIKPKGIIIECPYGSLYQTVCARFRRMKVPSFPMAGLLTFWGGIENGFWAFGLQPTEYAKKIKCPTLLLYGEQDKYVSRKEINEILYNIPGKKNLKTYKLAGHEDYLTKYKKEWTENVEEFLTEN